MTPDQLVELKRKVTELIEESGATAAEAMYIAAEINLIATISSISTMFGNSDDETPETENTKQ